MSEGSETRYSEKYNFYGGNYTFSSGASPVDSLSQKIGEALQKAIKELGRRDTSTSSEKVRPAPPTPVRLESYIRLYGRRIILPAVLLKMLGTKEFMPFVRNLFYLLKKLRVPEDLTPIIIELFSILDDSTQFNAKVAELKKSSLWAVFVSWLCRCSFGKTSTVSGATEVWEIYAPSDTKEGEFTCVRQDGTTQTDLDLHIIFCCLKSAAFVL